MKAPLAHYLAYLRPRTFVPTFLLALTGYAASPARPASALGCVADLALLFLVHSVLLWGGANAFNSSQDRDEGPVNLLPDPPPLPPRLAEFGLAANLLAIPLAALRGWRPAVILGFGVVVSTYYSWRGAPWRRGKEVGVVDNTINAMGSGFGAIALGYTFTPAPADARIVFLAVAFTIAIFGGVPTSQIFQLTPKDTYATARNYASLLGPRTTLRVGAVLFLAHVTLVLAVGWPAPRDAASVALLGGWAALAIAASGYSWRWSREPFKDPYRRMTRQLGMMMTSQTLFTIAAWLATRSARS
jgi:hypothetical protein